MTGSATRKPILRGGEKGSNTQRFSLPESPFRRTGRFTLQAKGVQWSLGMHGMVLLVIAVFQSFVVPQKVTVIDFTLAGTHASPVEWSAPHQEPAARREPHTGALKPKEKAAGASAPNPAVEKAPPPPPAASTEGEVPNPLSRNAEDHGTPSPAGKASPTFLSQTADGSGSPAATGAPRDPAGGAGRAQGMGEGSGNAGTGGTTQKSRAAYLKEHFVYIRDRINGGIAYPPLARKKGWCGQVKIAFVVGEDGGVNDVRVVESSGFGLLDRNALDTVKTAAPFPPPPVSAEIRMAITYRLN